MQIILQKKKNHDKYNLEMIFFSSENLDAFENLRIRYHHQYLEDKSNFHAFRAQICHYEVEKILQ